MSSSSLTRFRPGFAPSRWAILLASLLAVAACSGIEKREAIKDCRFSLKSVALKSLDLTGAAVQVLLDVQNPNGIEAILDGLSFDLLLDEQSLGQGRTDRALHVGPGASGELSITVRVGYAQLAGLVDRLQSGTPKSYRVKGQASVQTGLGTVPVPVNLSGSFR